MSISGFPGEDVDTHLKIWGHLPELECYEAGEPPIVCRNPKYGNDKLDVSSGNPIPIESPPMFDRKRVMQRQNGVRYMRRKRNKLERQRRKAGRKK